MKPKFYRYRHTFADGHGDWITAYINVDAEMDLDTMIKQVADYHSEEYWEFEHYRKTEAEWLEKAPVEWAQKEAESFLKRAASYTREAQSLMTAVEEAEVCPGSE